MSGDPDWSRLPGDLLDMILTKSEWPEDQIRFGAVCTSWRSAFSSTTAQRLLPCRRSRWIMDSFGFDADPDNDTDTTRNFFSIHANKTHKLNLPDTAGKSCRWSAHGWLLLAGDDNLLSLLNPLTRARIPLPPLPHPPSRLVRKFALSSNPTASRNVAAVILIQYTVLVHRIGWSEPWVKLSLLTPQPSYPHDVVFQDEMLYVRDSRGVTSFDVLSGSDIHGVVVDKSRWPVVYGAEEAVDTLSSRRTFEAFHRGAPHLPPLRPLSIPGEGGVPWSPEELDMIALCTKKPVLFKPCLW